MAYDGLNALIPFHWSRFSSYQLLKGKHTGFLALWIGRGLITILSVQTAVAQEKRPLKMLDQQSPCFHSSLPLPTPNHLWAVLQGLLCCTWCEELLRIWLPLTSLQRKECHSQIKNLPYQVSHNIVGCQFFHTCTCACVGLCAYGENVGW